MPKVKEPRVPLKGENPSKAPKLSETKRKAPPHSEEIVVESDSEGSNSESSSGHSSGSESDAERRKNTKKPKAKQVSETEPTNPPVPDDSSEEEDSTEDESSKDEADGLPDPDRTPKINGKVTKSEPKDVEMADASSEESSEEEPEETEEAQPAKNASAKSHVAKSTPAAAYEPPSAYSLVDMKSNDGASIRALIPESDTTKQIWHITAPAGIPLTDVKSLSLAKIDSKQSIFTHKSIDYSLVEDKSAVANEAGSHKHVLIPSGKGYTSIKAPVSRTLHVQQIISLPNLSKRQANPATGSNAAADANRSQVRGPKPQPKGLKMRYTPPGFGSGRPGAVGSDSSDDDDVEMADADAAPRTFQLPKNVSQSSKRKQNDVAEVTSKTPKADKKRRKDKDQVEAEKAEAEAAKAKEVVVEQSQALTEGTRAELPKTDAEKERLHDEKEQRKEERRLKRERKEERRKGRESAVA